MSAVWIVAVTVVRHVRTSPGSTQRMDWKSLVGKLWFTLQDYIFCRKKSSHKTYHFFAIGILGGRVDPREGVFEQIGNLAMGNKPTKDGCVAPPQKIGNRTANVKFFNYSPKTNIAPEKKSWL